MIRSKQIFPLAFSVVQPGCNVSRDSVSAAGLARRRNYFVDDMPDAAEFNQPFGNYAAKCEVKDGQLIFLRSLTLKAGTIPVDQYASVRGFFERIRAVEQTPVVLVKK